MSHHTRVALALTIAILTFVAWMMTCLALLSAPTKTPDRAPLYAPDLAA